MSDAQSDLVAPRPRVPFSPLFWLNLLVAAGLAGLVLAAPFIAEPGSPRMLGLFANDGTLRQTALASAIGLTVTAFVFFRPRSAERSPPSQPARTPPTNVVGA